METPYDKELKKTDAAKTAKAARRKAANNAERAAKAAVAKKTTTNESSESTSDTEVEAEKKSKNVDRIPRKQVPRSVPAPATVPEVVDEDMKIWRMRMLRLTMLSLLLPPYWPVLSASPIPLLMSIHLARQSRSLHAVRHQWRPLCLQHRTPADSVSHFNTRKSSRFRAKR
jgi:hypothetical protein